MDRNEDHVWSRQPWETDEEYLWFCRYVELGPEKRRCSFWIKLIRGKPLDLEVGNAANKNYWVLRAQHYDAHVAALGADEAGDRIETHAEVAGAHRKLARAKRRLAERELAKHLEQADANIYPTTSIREIGKFTVDAVQLERLVHGDGTMPVDTDDSVDWDSLSYEDARAYRELYERNRKGRAA